MPVFPSYLRTLVAVALLLMFGVVIINLIVNPFAIFPMPEISGVNFRKTEFFKHIRLVKAYQLRDSKPEVILTGNSRVDMAFDPQHPALSGYSGRVYNSALAGATIYEVLRYLQHAHRLAPVKIAVIGLDRSMFESKAKPDFDEAILASSVDGRVNAFPVANLIRTAISLDTLIASSNTLRRQHDLTTRQFRADGMRYPDSTAHAVRLADGYRVAFTRELTRQNENPNEPMGAQHKQMLEYFRLLLDFCRTEHIEAILFIHPLHAWGIENEWLLGQAESGEQWKRELVKLIAEEAGKSHVPFPLWDFSGYNTVTTEAVPPKADKDTTMRYFWEQRHYKQLTGDLILDRIFNFRSDTRSLPSDFGVLLNQANIDRLIDQARADRRDYQQRNRAEVMEISRLVSAERRY